MRLAALTTPIKKYYAIDELDYYPSLYPHLKVMGKRFQNNTLCALKNCRYSPVVTLAVGMPVILLANLSTAGDEKPKPQTRLVNGSHGRVVSLRHMGDEEWTKRFSCLKYEVSQEQLFQFVELEANQFRVVPRVQFDDNTEVDIFPRVVEERLSEEAFKYKRMLETRARVLRMAMGGEKTSETMQSSGHLKELSETGQKLQDIPVPRLIRAQVPLAPVWAMSIHKSQGMTLGKVVVDLSRAFAEGQVYVALSRAKSLMV